MKITQVLTDRLSIGLSVICAVHCLMMPVLLLMLPSLAALSLTGEAFHVWLLVAVIPCSVYALTLGCKQHKRYRLLLLGALGLGLLVLAVVLGADYLGELGEKILTVSGAILVSIGHWLNFKLCQHTVISSASCGGCTQT